MAGDTPAAAWHSIRHRSESLAFAVPPALQVLLPAQSFEDIPLVTPRDAMCLLTGLGCRAPALGVDPPGSEEGAPAPAVAPAAAA